MPLILGLESSCDDSAAALVSCDRQILAHAVIGQNSAHQPYGGVVPEIAARAHVEVLPGLIRQVMDDAAVAVGDIDAIAATAGPGLIGVDFLTPYRLAELLGAASLAAQGRRPVSTPVLSAAIRGVLTTEPGVFGPVADHPATEAAVSVAGGSTTRKARCW